MGPIMNHAFLYSLVLLVVSASCLLEYGGIRLLAAFTPAEQNRVAVVSLAACLLVLAFFRLSFAAANWFVLVIALVCGTLLARQIKSAGALAAMLVAAAIADLVSSYTGPTRWLIEHATHTGNRTALQFLAMSIPFQGRVAGIIGVVDLMFFAVCVTVARRLRWPEFAAVLAPLAGLLLALGIGLRFGPTPALPFLAGTVLLYVYGTTARNTGQGAADRAQGKTASFRP